MDFMSILSSLVLIGYGGVAGIVVGAVFMNPWLRRRMAWQIGIANKGFAFIVRAGRKAKRMNWDTREPCLDYGSKTYIIDPLDVFDMQNIPCILISDKIGRTIPCEKLPADLQGLYSPQSNFSFKTRLHDLFEARADLNQRKILGMKPEAFWTVMGIGVGLCLLMGFLSFQQSGSNAALIQEGIDLGKQILANTIPVIK